MNIYSIYCITNTINDKKYIGYTSNHIKRFKYHTKNYHKNPNKPLYAAFIKYGVQNFTFDVIYQSLDKLRSKNVMEKYFITEYNTNIREGGVGYNLTKGGDGGPGVTSTQATLNNLNRIAEGTHIFLDPEFRRANRARTKERVASMIQRGVHPFQNSENRYIYTGDPITINNTYYNSKQEACDYLNISLYILNQIIKTVPEYTEIEISESYSIYRKGIKYHKPSHDTSPIPVTINGVEYKSMYEARKALKVSSYGIRKMLQNEVETL